MLEMDIQVAIELFKDVDFYVLICDEQYNFIWKNSYTLDYELECLNQNTISDFFTNNPSVMEECLLNVEKGKNYKSQCKLSSCSLDLEFKPMLHGGKRYILCIANKRIDLPSFSMTEEENLQSLALVGEYRNSIFNIYNVLQPLAQKLESMGEYDDIVYINNISKNCHRMLKTTICLSEYYKLKNKDAKLKLVQVSMHNYLENLIMQVQILLCDTKKEIKLTVDDKKLIANLDSNKMTIALLNIITNSLDFSPQESTIHMHMRRANDNIVLTIKDEGVGIASKNIQRVFEPFYSFDPSTNMPKGIGLGLTVAKQIVLAHQGNMLVSSQENSGTTITVRIPVCETYDSTISFGSSASNQMANKLSMLYVFLSGSCDFSLF